jgi:hypothetical protein
MKGPESRLTNSPERSGERVHDQEEILALIAERIPGLPGIEELKGKIVRRLSDAAGLYLLELEVAGSVPGQTIEYRYVRAGNQDPRNSTDASRIDMVLYVDGDPDTSDQLAKFNVVTQEWDKT